MRHILAATFFLLACGESTTPNTNPEVIEEIPDQLVSFEGKAVHLDNHFTDADGDKLVYSVSNDRPEAILAEMKGSSLVLRQLVIDPGTLAEITVTATDPESGTTSTSFTAEGSRWLEESWNNDLGEWEEDKDLTSQVYFSDVDSAEAVVKNGLLYLYPASNQPIQAGVGVIHDFPAIERNWTIRTSTALSSSWRNSAACSVIDAYTEDRSLKMLRFVFDQYSNSWRLYVGTNHPNEQEWDPYFFGLAGGARNKDWHHGPLREFVDISVSLIDSFITVKKDGEELANFDLLKMYVTGENPISWPPNVFPSGLVKVGVRNFPACGPMPPDRGRRLEHRNTIVVDWVQVEKENGR